MEEISQLFCNIVNPSLQRGPVWHAICGSEFSQFQDLRQGPNISYLKSISSHAKDGCVGYALVTFLARVW
jgi:hypothetical protein